MTGYSAKVDETGKWFETSLPGRLSDVFGLRTNAFYRSEEPLKFMFDGEVRTGTDTYYEVLELGAARPLAVFDNVPQKSAAIAINSFGKGRAIYLATAAQPSLIGPLIRSIYPSLGIERGPVTSAGVVARIVEGRTLVVNTNNAPATFVFSGTREGILGRKTFSGKIELPAYGVELLQ